jgi:peptidoglycan/LPS O-acetylase OafA/YrhL
MAGPLQVILLALVIGLTASALIKPVRPDRSRIIAGFAAGLGLLVASATLFFHACGSGSPWRQALISSLASGVVVTGAAPGWRWKHAEATPTPPPAQEPEPEPEP